MKFLFCILIFFFQNSNAFAEDVSVVLDVKFKSGVTAVQPSQGYVVDNLYKVVSKFPEARIYILGHTDSSGSDVANQKLSEARAQSIYTKLISSGADSKKVTVKGMGETAPIADNVSTLGRAKNRRVVATFTNLDDKKIEELKKTLSNTRGLTVLSSESDLVKSFIANNETVALQKQKTVEASKNNKSSKHRLAKGVSCKKSCNKKKCKKNKCKKDKKICSTTKCGKSKKVCSKKQCRKEKKMCKTSKCSKSGLRYRLATGAYYNVLDAEDRDNSNANAEWVSELNIPFGGELQYKVSHFWLGLKAFGHIQEYKIERERNYAWDEESPFLFRGSLTADYEKKRIGISFDLDFNQESSIYETDGNVRLEKELFIGATVGAKYKWLDGPLSSRVGLDLSYPFAASSSDIDSGGEFGYIVSLYLRKEKAIKNHGIAAKLYYGHRNLSNNQNDQSEEVLGLMLSIDSNQWL